MWGAGFGVCSHPRAGWVYAAAATLRADLAVDALNMALAARRCRCPGGLVHHSDREKADYLSVCYTTPPGR